MQNEVLRVLCCGSWPVLHTPCTGALCCWNTKLSTTTCLAATNIYWDSKTSCWYCPLAFTPGSTKNNSDSLDQQPT